MSAVLAIVLAGEDKKSGPIGLAVILVLCIACYFLFKSMSKHLRKVREEFPADGSETASTPSAENETDSAEQAVVAEQSAPTETTQVADEPPPA